MAVDLIKALLVASPHLPSTTIPCWAMLGPKSVPIHMPTEKRGITIQQVQNLHELCADDGGFLGWDLWWGVRNAFKLRDSFDSFENLKLYHAKDWVIKPASWSAWSRVQLCWVTWRKDVTTWWGLRMRSCPVGLCRTQQSQFDFFSYLGQWSPGRFYLLERFLRNLTWSGKDAVNRPKNGPNACNLYIMFAHSRTKMERLNAMNHFLPWFWRVLNAMT